MIFAKIYGLNTSSGFVWCIYIVWMSIPDYLWTYWVDKSDEYTLSIYQMNNRWICLVHIHSVDVNTSRIPPSLLYHLLPTNIGSQACQTWTDKQTKFKKKKSKAQQTNNNITPPSPAANKHWDQTTNKQTSKLNKQTTISLL